MTAHLSNEELRRTDLRRINMGESGNAHLDALRQREAANRSARLETL